MDYEAFGFERREFAASVEPYLLSDTETQLVQQLRGVMERLLSVSQASAKQAGARYGFRQIGKAFMRRASRGGKPVDYRVLDA